MQNVFHTSPSKYVTKANRLTGIATRNVVHILVSKAIPENNISMEIHTKNNNAFSISITFQVKVTA
jgi:hypothetical protein